MNRKILMSAGSLLFSAALIAGATFAFFSDTETSAGNTFTAGSIDLKIANDSYYNGQPSTTGTTWSLSDISNQLFFNFNDIKPGDHGEDTITFQVDDNPAWLCADITITQNDDVDCTTPEIAAEGPGVCNNGALLDGELASNLEFAFWADDGDNVYENNEGALFGTGQASDVLNGRTYALADEDGNVWQPAVSPAPAVLPGEEGHVHLGKAWCFGDLNVTAATPSESHSPATANNVTCNGAALGNATQTDNLVGTLSFRAVQERSNPTFDCETTRPIPN